MKTDIAKRIAHDPKFDPTSFFGDVIIDWIQSNDKTIIKECPDLIGYLIPDSGTWTSLAQYIPLESEHVDNLVGTFVNAMDDNGDLTYYARGSVVKLFDRIWGKKESNLTDIDRKHLLAFLPFVSNSECLKGVVHYLSESLASKLMGKLISAFNQRAMIHVLEAAPISELGYVQTQLSNRFELRCPSCSRKLKSRPGYTLHIKNPERSSRGYTVNNACFQAKSVFDVLNERLYDKKTNKGWFIK